MAEDGFKLVGFAECVANLEKLPQTILEILAKAMYEEALLIMAEAKRRVPVLTGQLRDSGRVQDPVITAEGISITMSFGDETVDWAIPVHERMNVRHVTGRSKFLESVILEQGENLLQKIANRAESYLERMSFSV